jgi:hypothetical protein
MHGSPPFPGPSQSRDESPFRCDSRVPEGSLVGFSVLITDSAGYCAISVAHFGRFRVLLTLSPDGAVTIMRRAPQALDCD